MHQSISEKAANENNRKKYQSTAYISVKAKSWPAAKAAKAKAKIILSKAKKNGEALKICNENEIEERKAAKMAWRMKENDNKHGEIKA